MADHESTMKWKVDISQLKAAMQDAKRSISLANAEFKTATAGIDKWSQSTTGLEAKIKQLNSILPEQRKILADLEQQYTLTAENMGENSAEAQRLKISIENQKASIAKTEAQIDKYNASLDKMQAEEKQASSALNKLNSTISEQQSKVDALKTEYQNAVVQYGKTSKEARTLAKQLKQVSGELAENKDKLKEADKAADQFDQSIDDAADSAQAAANGGFTVLKGALANLVSQGINKALDGIKNFASTMISEAATVRAEASQFEQTFGDMGDEASAAIKRVADASGILDTRLNTVGAQIYAFARSSGASVPEAMELMETGLQAAADSAAYYDKSLAESAETLQSFLKGNYANDAALGVSATEFTRNAKATELFGKKYNDLTEIQKQQTLLKMVTDAQKLSGAMGQAAREADGWENVQGNLNEAWRQFKAQVGTPFLEQLIPVIQKVTSSFQDWVKKVNWKQFNKEVENVANAIKTGFKWVIDNRHAILETLKAIAVAFVTYKAVATITSVITAFNKFTTAVKAGETVMKALNMSMSASPIGLIVGALAGLTTLYIAHNKKVQEAIDKQYGLNKAEQESIDKVSALAEEYNRLNDVRNESVKDINAEFSYIQQLKDNYNSLIDSNGKVKKGYEDRAQFILNQLAQAMGVEVTDIQKLIDKNGELGESIDKLIQKKQAEAVLAANEEMYNAAIKERSSALNDLTAAQETLESAEARYSDTKSQANEVWEKYNELMKYAPDAAAEYLEANNQIILSNESARKAYEEAKTGVENAENAWIGYNSTIQNYEGLAEAIISGDTEKINAAMQNMVNNFITAETGNRESLERQVDNYRSNLDALEKAIKNGTPNVTKEMVDQAKAMVEAAEKELDKLPPEAEKIAEDAGSDYAKGIESKKSDAKKSGENVAGEAKKGAESVKADKSGENFGQGFIDGLASMASNAWTAGWNFVKKAWEGLKAGQQEGSPSKLTRKSGEFFGEGFALGIQDMMKPVANVASDMANGAVDAMADALGINSPSKVAQDKIGKNLVLGIIQGVKAEKKNAKKSASELANLYISAAKTRVSDLKKANKMSLAEEVDFWNQMSNQVKKHSAAYNAALAQMETAKKSLNSAAEKLTKTYISDVSKINQELEKNIASLEDSYLTYASQRADQLKSAFGLFDAVRMDTKKSKDALKENLQNQVQALKEYDSTLSALEKRLGSNSDIVAELRKMGVSSVETMKSLNSMSDVELKEYEKLYEEKNKLAEKRADAESATLKKSIEKQISQLKASAKKQINALTATYEEELAELQGSVGSSGKQIGKAISDGINSGMTAGMKNLTDSLKKQVKNLVNSVKKQLKIKSPSRVFADEIGKMMPLGIAEGFKNAMPDAENTMQASIMKAVNDLKGDMSNINWQMGGQFGGGAAASVGETINEQNITFNQYNNSPKALDRLSVYRDTNNLLFSAKVRLNNV